jgi:hypothetical protein
MIEFDEGRGNDEDILEHDLNIRCTRIRVEGKLSDWDWKRVQIEFDDH